MRRLEVAGYGRLPGSVRFADVPVPAIGDDDVLIKVRAAALNPIDYKVAQGELRRVLSLDLPAPFGFDCSGRIEAAGSSVTGFAAGDRVYLRAPRERMGSFAEYLAVDAKYVSRAPRRLSAIEAASIPLVALTTVQALVVRAQAVPGQRVLIHAGSGGLGSFAVQYAKAVLGLHVTTTTSSRNAAWVRELGADIVIAYDQQDYRASSARYDVVFDTIGGRTTADSFAVLKRGGTVVSVAGPPDWSFARQVGARLPLAAVMWVLGLPLELRARLNRGHYYRFLTESSGAQLEQVARVLDAGKLRPVIDRVYPFGQAIEALQYLATGRARGKVILEM